MIFLPTFTKIAVLGILPQRKSMGICHSLKAKILVLFELTFTKNFKFLELHGHLCGGHKQMLPMKMENSQTHGRELKLGYLVTNLCSSSIQTG